MKKERLRTRKELAVFLKELRLNLTPAEAFLWNQLKARKFQGKQFTKQHSIGNYIVDFYCPTEKLIIELDGEVHNNPNAIEYDENRTKFLENVGFKVMHFENKMIFENLSAVLKEINDNFSIKNKYYLAPPFRPLRSAVKPSLKTKAYDLYSPLLHHWNSFPYLKN